MMTMSTAYLISAVIAFSPASYNQPKDQLVLPIRRSFDSQQECNDFLRKRISDHMAKYQLPSVRQELSTGSMCRQADLIRNITEDEDRAYFEKVTGSLRQAQQQENVLNEFTR
jgi:hypothetical protein